MKRRISTLLLALVLCAGVFFISPVRAAETERFTLEAFWLDEDLLSLEICDAVHGTTSNLELRISDYAENCATISLQAVDEAGNASELIRIANPAYQPPESSSDVESDPVSGGSEADGEISALITGNESETVPEGIQFQSTSKGGAHELIEEPVPTSQSAVTAGSNPLTPAGTGSVLDNATEQEGKEFFTVEAEDGSIFYLIVDRQKSGENVYLLSAVRDSDLLPLAEKEEESVSVIPDPQPEPPTPSSEPEAKPVVQQPSGPSSTSLLLILLVAAVVGGAGYLLRQRQRHRAGALLSANDDYLEEDDDFDDEDENDEDE